MEVGLLGGTFDPLHKGHLHLLESAIDAVGLDAVVLMPAGSPYHKKDQIVSPAVYRYELCKRVLKKHHRIMLSDLEILRDKPSYTLDTIESLEPFLSPNGRLALIYGSDVLFTIVDWHEPLKLMSRARLLIALRPEDDALEAEAQADFLRARYGADIYFIKAKQLPISSTQIRRAVQAAKPGLYLERCELVERYLATEPALPRMAFERPQTDQRIFSEGGWQDWVEPRAAEFIDTNELYLKEMLLAALKPETRARLMSIERKLLGLISRKRLIHSWNTLFCALEMALRFSINPDKTALAALIHDGAKELSREDMLLLIPAAERSSQRKTDPAVLHGPAGAELARQIFDIDDEEIASAIYYHTTLRENPSALEKAIFLADKIEPGRSFKNLDSIRKLSRRHLNAAALLCLKEVERFLLRENLKPHPHSKAALHSLVREVKLEPITPESDIALRNIKKDKF